MKAYILTREINQYDQEGEYFAAWFHAKPTIGDVKAAADINDDKLASHILSGGGRQGIEDEWWYLREVISANISVSGPCPPSLDSTNKNQLSGG